MTITIHRELEQGSDEWLQARCGLLTASVIGKLITPTLKVADNDTSRGVLFTLAAERITGHVDYVHPTFDMQRGTDDEPFARLAYAEHEGVQVEEVGFITLTTDKYVLGYSPDGLVGKDGLIEIKSRRPNVQMATILNDTVPTANLMQIQCGLFVTGRRWLDYVSFCAGLPLYVKRIYPDPSAFNAIEAAATAFELNLADLIARYTQRVEGMPMTERRPELDEIRI